MTLYSTVMRRSELCHLRPEDIDKERMVVRIRQGKGGKDRAGAILTVLLWLTALTAPFTFAALRDPIRISGDPRFRPP